MQTAPAPLPRLRAAAIVDDGQSGVDALLASIARRQRDRGRQVRGIVMTHRGSGSGCAAEAMVLVDIHRGDEYVVSQPLGACATACRADPQGFARASQVLRRAADETPDLVIANRFGRLEAEGGGFRAELLELMARDIVLLTTVAARYVDDWRRFTDGDDAALLLPADEAAIEAWLAQTLAPATLGHA